MNLLEILIGEPRTNPARLLSARPPCAAWLNHTNVAVLTITPRGVVPAQVRALASQLLGSRGYNPHPASCRSWLAHDNGFISFHDPAMIGANDRAWWFQ